MKRAVAPLFLAVPLFAGLLGGCATPTTPTTPEAITPPPTESLAPVSAVELAAGEDPDGIEVEVGGPSQVVFRKITLQPGAGTGEHCHAGQLIAVVQEGVFTHYAPIYPDGVRVYQAGEAIVEGAGYVHQGVNEGDVPMVLLVTYLIEEGQPLAQTDLALCEG